MIFVLAGTQDGREIVRLLLEQGHDVAASVVSSYGGELLAHACGQRCLINDKPLDEAARSRYREQYAEFKDLEKALGKSARMTVAPVVKFYPADRKALEELLAECR